LYCAHLLNLNNVYAVGGAQAIAALTFGTSTIPRADKLFGPGNQYVMMAKQLSGFYGLATDLPAGPSEVLVITDENADPELVAADLLAQAEHGPDSQVVLVTTEEKMIPSVQSALNHQLEQLPRKAMAETALEQSHAIVFSDINECIEFSNMYAPEHLIVLIEKPQLIIDRITNAGSVFIGDYTPEAAGDYASGTNHTLPTNGFARSYSGVSLDSFVKKITFQEISANGLARLGPNIEVLAEAEELHAHKNAVSIRLKKINP
jgi:histidinol dehydrogenase